MKDRGPSNGRGGSPSPLPTGMRTKRSPDADPGAGRECMIAFVVKDSADDEERRRAEAIVAAGAPKWSKKSSKSPARHVRPLPPFLSCANVVCCCANTDTASH